VPGNMVKHVCVGLTALSCLVIAMAADAADLSMVPIYQARPSATAALNGSPKDDSRPANVPDPGRFKLLPGTGVTGLGATSTGVTGTGAITRAAPPSGHVFWTGVYDRL
jgi:hypothetical protein